MICLSTYPSACRSTEVTRPSPSYVVVTVTSSEIVFRGAQPEGPEVCERSGPHETTFVGRSMASKNVRVQAPKSVSCPTVNALSTGVHTRHTRPRASRSMSVSSPVGLTVCRRLP